MKALYLIALLFSTSAIASDATEELTYKLEHAGDSLRQRERDDDESVDRVKRALSGPSEEERFYQRQNDISTYGSSYGSTYNPDPLGLRNR